jgi:hypothetical protein
VELKVSESIQPIEKKDIKHSKETKQTLHKVQEKLIFNQGQHTQLKKQALELIVKYQKE